MFAERLTQQTDVPEHVPPRPSRSSGWAAGQGRVCSRDQPARRVGRSELSSSALPAAGPGAGPRSMRGDHGVFRNRVVSRQSGPDPQIDPVWSLASLASCNQFLSVCSFSFSKKKGMVAVLGKAFRVGFPDPPGAPGWTPVALETMCRGFAENLFWQLDPPVFRLLKRVCPAP